jgi:hypothetical protein
MNYEPAFAKATAGKLSNERTEQFDYTTTDVI